MSAVAYDSLEYAIQLESAGMPRAQAEVVAKGLTSMFIHNFEALVTKDFLDSRFTEFEMRIGADIDEKFERFGEQIDGNFTSIEERFTSIEERFVKNDERFVALDLKLEGIKGQFNLVYWMLAVSIASTVIPAIQGLYASL